ncbi:hypothetical protein HBI98_08950 [Aeromonas veronii]|nr:hypothetical protein [Aeromonas veronii]
MTKPLAECEVTGKKPVVRHRVSHHKGIKKERHQALLQIQ